MKEVAKQNQPLSDASIQLPALPNELWLYIFHYVLRNNPFLPSSQSGAFVLSWVCDRWRSWVISEPRFWTKIHLSSSPVGTGRKEKLEKLVDLCLSRSKQYKLDIVLTDFRCNQRPEDKRIHLLTLPLFFLNTSDRWRSLLLNIAAGPRMLNRFSRLKGHLKSLKSCTIIYRLQRQFSYNPKPIEFLENATQLQALCLMTHLFPTKVLFNKLTDVDLVPDMNSLEFPLTVKEFLDILGRCPNISRLRLVCNLSDNDGPLSRPVATHRKIRELHIFGRYIGILQNGDTIFDFLNLPFLTIFSITSHQGQASWGILHDSLDRFLAQIQGLLRLQLHFHHQMHFAMREPLKHLRLTPKLQHLFIEIKNMGYSKDDILSGLLEDDGSYAWPSALQRLYYWTINCDSIFAISSTPCRQNPPYLQRSTITQEAST